MLDKKSLKALKKLYKCVEMAESEFDEKFVDRQVVRENVCATNLIRKKLIERCFDDNGNYYRITFDGCAVVEEHRRSGVLFWLPYSITTAIALLSLVFSLVR